MGTGSSPIVKFLCARARIKFFLAGSSASRRCYCYGNRPIVQRRIPRRKTTFYWVRFQLRALSLRRREGERGGRKEY